MFAFGLHSSVPDLMFYPKWPKQRKKQLHAQLPIYSNYVYQRATLHLLIDHVSNETAVGYLFNSFIFPRFHFICTPCFCKSGFF